MSNYRAIRPAPGECAEYYRGYIDQVPDGDIIELLGWSLDDSIATLEEVPPERRDHRYAPGKWSLREVVGHVVDTERIFAYRALRFARADTSELPGMEQDDYVRHGRFARRPWDDLLEEFESLREANLALFRSFEEEEMDRGGIASGHPVTVRALLWIMAGHERHHLGVIRGKYL